jgi:uncharacterized delta-60 repeat protein
MAFNLSLLGASGGGGIAYWLATLGGASGETGKGIVCDSSNNVYGFGETYSTGAGSRDFLLSKRDPEGSIVWQRSLGGAGGEEGNDLAIDTSGNLYCVGRTDSAGAGSSDFLLAKYNSSGTIQWQRILGGSDNDTAYGIALDSASNVYLSGYTFSQGAGSADFVIAKYNSSGTIQWQRVLGGASNDRAAKLGIDSSDNVYITGLTESAGAGNEDLLLAKYNSSGTIQWQRVLGLSAGNDNGQAVSFDSSDNVYVVGQSAPSGGFSFDFVIAKYNSSGTIQWQRTLGESNFASAHDVAVDSSDNVYVLGRGDGQEFILAKYDSSGTIQFQRSLGAASERGFGITIDSQGSLLLIGLSESGASGEMLIAKLPSDGSLTGTYNLNGVNIVYQGSSLTAATSTLTDATSTLTSATSTLTAATSTLTDSSSSLTSHFVEIPA